MVSFFTAATVVAVVQYFRTRESRLLPLAVLFLLLAAAHVQQDWRWAQRLEMAAGLAGLVLVVMLAPRGQARP
jgi:hypothetical protein